MNSRTNRNIAVALIVAFGMVSCATSTGTAAQKAQTGPPAQEEQQAKQNASVAQGIGILALGIAAALIGIPVLAGKMGSFNIR